MDRFFNSKTLFVFVMMMFSLECSEGKKFAVDWKSCGGKEFMMTDITFSPNPFQIPGNVSYTASIAITTRLENLSGKVTLKKRNGSIYEDFPYDCKFGGILVDSCGHDDLCTEWAKGDCPMNIKAINKDCTCPLEAGTYKLIPYRLEIPDDLEIGQYRLKEEMIMNEVVIGCVESAITITD